MLGGGAGADLNSSLTRAAAGIIETRWRWTLNAFWTAGMNGQEPLC